MSEKYLLTENYIKCLFAIFALFVQWTLPEFTGKYAYIESSEPQASGDKAVLVSDMMTGQQCMRFKYHMHGEDTASLSIYRRGSLVWKEIGNHGNRWLQGQVDFDCSMSQYQVSYSLKQLSDYICSLMADDNRTTGKSFHIRTG